MSYTWVWWHRSYNGKISNSSQVFSGSPCSVVVFQCWCVRSVVDPLLSTHHQFDSPGRFDLGLWIFHLLYFCTCVDHTGFFSFSFLYTVLWFIPVSSFPPSLSKNLPLCCPIHSPCWSEFHVILCFFLPQNNVKPFGSFCCRKYKDMSYQ